MKTRKETETYQFWPQNQQEGRFS